MNTPFGPISKETGLLLDWYDQNARQLPWRIGPKQLQAGQIPDPYRVWLSEIMLQQTQVVTVIGYFEKFTRQWPTLTDLANASEDDVLKAWAGLGYYSRARNLWQCARIICERYNGKFPHAVAELKSLPGIGDYTSAAIAAIAFSQNVAVIDGNVERVMTRKYAISTPLPRAKAEIKTRVSALLSDNRSGDFAQALMDLGAGLCTPKNPDCNCCPWQLSCVARANSSQTDFPVKPQKKVKPTRRGAAFVAISTSGEILLRKRGDSGMLPGMSEVPSSDWSHAKNGEVGISAAPFRADWLDAGEVRHEFTHFRLNMKVYYSISAKPDNVLGWWVAQSDVMDEALPSLMKKILTVALGRI